MKRGKLFLIPMPIAEGTQDLVVTTQVRNSIAGIKYFLAENVRTARRLLSSLKLYDSIEELHFDVLDKDTDDNQLTGLMKPLADGNQMGILSESGCPGVADPGALAVEFAHLHGFQVVPLVGPSSIIMALMASGLNGQQFAFHGYLPIDEKELIAVLKGYEKESISKNQTQIFIETPYRNNRTLKLMLKALKPETTVCLALDLTGAKENIICHSVKKWPKTELSKLPAVFLFQA